MPPKLSDPLATLHHGAHLLWGVPGGYRSFPWLRFSSIFPKDLGSHSGFGGLGNRTLSAAYIPGTIFPLTDRLRTVRSFLAAAFPSPRPMPTSALVLLLLRHHFAARGLRPCRPLIMALASVYYGNACFVNLRNISVLRYARLWRKYTEKHNNIP